jgi:hypothetical protein
MLQPDTSLPDVPEHPAPWDLDGRGWIFALKLARGAPALDAFLPPEFAGQGRSLASYLMYVDYSAAPCGPYRELLFIPGAFRFGDGRRHLTISRIVVSTWDSVVNGRNNWGIPKDRADFDVAQGEGPWSPEQVKVSCQGRVMCEFTARPLRLAPRLPVPGALLPQGLRTLAQRFRGRDYYYAPSASGWIRPGKLLDWRFDASLFPDLADASVVAALQVLAFRMRFPVARVA